MKNPTPVPPEALASAPQHSPLPWRVSTEIGRSARIVNEAEGFSGRFRIADCNFNSTLARCASHAEARANAAFIIEACNQHAHLRERVRQLETMLARFAVLSDNGLPYCPAKALVIEAQALLHPPAV